MKDIQLLDCTLRDGGRLIDCSFQNNQIRGMISSLMETGIEIIEIGFLRNHIEYMGNSTFFRTVQQAEKFISNSNGQIFVLFIDHGLYDVEELSTCSGIIQGIRFGFTKKDFQNEPDVLMHEMHIIKEKGYRLFIQGVNTISYSDQELLEVISLVNEISPYSFGIVDTYGCMYTDDLERLFTLVNFNLSSHILIDFHGHNNMQMAFSLAQKMISLCQGKRQLIIDATLDGMGKCAGNLNTELITNYLNQRYQKDYNFDCLLDTIDTYVEKYKEKFPWGYSIASFMAGVYKAHPNNVIYLTNKFRLSTKDIRKMLSFIEEPKRQRYDYDNIQKIYKNYFAEPMDDSEAIRLLKSRLSGSTIFILAAGHSIKEYAEIIQDYINTEHPIIISVNFIDIRGQYAFFGNDRRYQNINPKLVNKSIILTSNVQKRTNQELVVSYMNCIAESGNYFDNSTLMLLNLLQQLEVSHIRIAGMDGFYKNKPNYFNEQDEENRCTAQYESINRELEGHLLRFLKRNQGHIDVRFVTPSRFEHITIE